jgi:hypothetical protein
MSKEGTARRSGRWKAKRKFAAVLCFLRAEDLETLSLELA